MTLDSFNAFTVTVTPQSVLWKYTYLIHLHVQVINIYIKMHVILVLRYKLNSSRTTKYMYIKGWTKSGCLRRGGGGGALKAKGLNRGRKQ